MKYAVLFAGIVFGCSSDPGGVPKPMPPPPAPPGLVAGAPTSTPFDCSSAVAQFGRCMLPADFDATAASVGTQNTTQGPCYSCHAMGLEWFRARAQLIAACASNQLMFVDGVSAIGQSGGTHASFVMSQARERALHDFFDRTLANFASGNCP